MEWVSELFWILSNSSGLDGLSSGLQWGKRSNWTQMSFNVKSWSLPGNDRAYQDVNLTSVIMKKSSPGSPCTTIFSPSSNWTGSSASATVSRSHLSRDSKILKIIKLYYKKTLVLAEDLYLNWQLCYACFCYKRNISFTQALCTNLQLGNMNVFIHCVLDFRNHSDNNLKSWTGKVGSGSLCLWSDLRCPDAAADCSSLGIVWRYQQYMSAADLLPHPTPNARKVLLSSCQSCSQRVTDDLLGILAKKPI